MLRNFLTDAPATCCYYVAAAVVAAVDVDAELLKALTRTLWELVTHFRCKSLWWKHSDGSKNEWCHELLADENIKGQATYSMHAAVPQLAVQRRIEHVLGSIGGIDGCCKHNGDIMGYPLLQGVYPVSHPWECSPCCNAVTFHGYL